MKQLACALIITAVVAGCSTESDGSTTNPTPPTATTTPQQSPSDEPDHGSSTSDPTQPPPPGMWERGLRRAMRPLGVTNLEGVEHDFQSSNLVGTWRGRGVKVAYYTDPVHAIDPKRAGVEGKTATVEIAGVRVVRVDWKGFPASLLRAKCGDDFYEVTVFDGLDAFAAEPDHALTTELMTALLQSPACS